MAQADFPSPWPLNGSLELDQDINPSWLTLIPSVGSAALVCIVSFALLSVYSIRATSKVRFHVS